MKHLMPWLLATSLTACGDAALLSVNDGTGPSPSYPPPYARPCPP